MICVREWKQEVVADSAPVFTFKSYFVGRTTKIEFLF